jgi:hypothetical protein
VQLNVHTKGLRQPPREQLGLLERGQAAGMRQPCWERLHVGVEGVER